MHGFTLNTSPSVPPLVETARPSACPGLFRVVRALDGGICRIKLPGGSISSAQARAVAEAAQQFAGGVIEATNRANLQIRGIGEAHAALVERLVGAGLGSSTVSGDDVRNLMLSPCAGLDRHSLVDIRPLAEDILASLQSHQRFHQLSAKFAVQLDAGEALAMLEHHHDVWLSATEVEGRMMLAFGLAGSPIDPPLAAVPLAVGHELVFKILELFLDLARNDQTRMRHLLAEYPAADFLAQLTQRLSVAPVPVSDWCRRVDTQSLHLGVHAQCTRGRVYVGTVAPLGRLDPLMLSGAASLADEYGDGTLRFTPWQGLLLPNLRERDAPHVCERLQQLGWLCFPTQALARVIACTGSAGCEKSRADTKHDGLQLAALLQQQDTELSVHLSGCPRSCAAAHIAPVTLLAVSPGHYDLYFREAGQPGFGALHARNLTIEAVGALLDARSRSPF